MSHKVRVAVLDDHQTIIDGYLYRLEKQPQIEVVGIAQVGEALAPLLKRQPVDVLLMDVNVPLSADNHNPYPIFSWIPQLLQQYPDLTILVISLHTERTLIQALMETGISGYILKDDAETLRELGAVVLTVARGGIHFSPQAYHKLMGEAEALSLPLSPRQLQALSMCAAYPQVRTADLAKQMGIAHSTLRNLLSEAYLRLGVTSRTSAILKAYEIGLLVPAGPPQAP